MASSPPILPSEEDNSYSTPIFRLAARRNSSFSSSSESSFGSSTFSNYIDQDFPPFSPRSPLKFKGVPFSWEQIPGIPKQKDSKNKEYSSHLLPLPPAGSSYSSANKWHNLDEISPKKHHSTRFHQRDPFFAALVECSKDDSRNRGTHYDDNTWRSGSKITRSLSDKFGSITMYTSCKTTCAVSESLVYLPRSSPHSFLSRRSS